MVTNKAIILTMNHGDSLFLLKDPGIKMTRIDSGPLLDKIIIWITEEIKTKESVFGYYFSNNEKNPYEYGYLRISYSESFGRGITVIRTSEHLEPHTLITNYEFRHNNLEKMSDKWEQYIFISKEEEKK